MAQMKGLEDADFYIGDIEAPLPNWRDHKDKLIDDDDAEFKPLTDEARASLNERTGFDTAAAFADKAAEVEEAGE